jgi:pilus assembly protein Flp/PilA
VATGQNVKIVDATKTFVNCPRHKTMAESQGRGIRELGFHDRGHRTMLDYARTWLALRPDKRGVTAMEYGLIAALMAVVIVAAVGALGSGIQAAFTSIAGHLTSGT